jgi:hypothetical protein
LKSALLAHCAATLFMTGVIWFVQLVHYPLFDRVQGDGFGSYAALHGRLTTWVVAPPMLVELVTGALLLWRRPAAVGLPPAAVGFALILVVWLSTFLLQVPQHTALGAGFDDAAHRTLVLTNWLRTAVWTLRSLLVLWMVAATMEG